MGTIKKIKLLVTDFIRSNTTIKMIQYLSRLLFPRVIMPKYIPTINCTHQKSTVSIKKETVLEEDKWPYPTHSTGTNYMKEGEDPILKHPDEYPDWLWELTKPELKLEEMSPETHGAEYWDKFRKEQEKEDNKKRKLRPLGKRTMDTRRPKRKFMWTKPMRIR